MRTPIISDLKFVTQEMIDNIEIWLKKVKNKEWKAGNACPFSGSPEFPDKGCKNFCGVLFSNKLLENKEYCPCYDYNFGEGATILAFTIICDVWEEYHKRGKDK